MDNIPNIALVVVAVSFASVVIVALVCDAVIKYRHGYEQESDNE